MTAGAESKADPTSNLPLCEGLPNLHGNCLVQVDGQVIPPPGALRQHCVDHEQEACQRAHQGYHNQRVQQRLRKQPRSVAHSTLQGSYMRWKVVAEGARAWTGTGHSMSCTSSLMPCAAGTGERRPAALLEAARTPLAQSADTHFDEAEV